MSKGTPLRSIRVPDALWASALEQAERDGTTITAVLVEALRTFITPPPPAR